MGHVAITTAGLCALVFLGAPLLRLILRTVLVATFLVSHGLEPAPADDEGVALAAEPRPAAGPWADTPRLAA